MNNISLAAVLIVALAIPCCAIAQTQAPAPKQAGAPPATSAPAPKQAGAPPVTSAPAPKQSGAAAAAAAPKAPAPVTAVAPPTEAAKPVIRASHRVPSNADARACLEFPTNLQIIKCAEKYRWAS